MNPSKATLRIRCEEIVYSLVGSSLSDKWWTGKNKAFDDLTPAEQWEKDYMSVYRYLIRFYDGGGW